jgi:RimJ/RimL family protein N-acetyltransferase
VSNDIVRLRPFREPDLEFLVRLATDPAFSEPFEWFGFRSPDAFRRRWEEDGFLGRDPHYLAVVSADDIVGWVMWRETTPHGHGVFEIGALVDPDHRGQGVGTVAQGQLVDYVFSTTTAHRLWAGTEVDNVAEQRSLEKCGFRREGVLRDAHFRDGGWRDAVVYGRLRDDPVGP